ncbi:MAG: hypothetical protein IK020_03725 [Clostridiales bacterium]|nr:hypothetical protein [Clostridiales bacterium]
MIDVDISCKEALLTCYRNELVPENTKINQSGIHGLLLYRKYSDSSGRHPDTALTHPETNWISKKLFGFIPESQDTIFNCWSILKIYDAVHNGQNKTRSSDDVLESLEAGEEIIKPEHRAEFDLLADRQHSIANFMPASRGFNGYRGHPGKGDYSDDNDFPDIYYERAETEFPDMYKWIKDHMDDYSLQLFAERITPWKNGEANFGKMVVKPDEELLFEIAKKMNRLLSDRAENLIRKVQ